MIGVLLNLRREASTYGGSRFFSGVANFDHEQNSAFLLMSPSRFTLFLWYLFVSIVSGSVIVSVSIRIWVSVSVIGSVSCGGWVRWVVRRVGWVTRVMRS